MCVCVSVRVLRAGVRARRFRVDFGKRRLSVCAIHSIKVGARPGICYAGYVPTETTEITTLQLTISPL